MYKWKAGVEVIPAGCGRLIHSHGKISVLFAMQVPSRLKAEYLEASET